MKLINCLSISVFIFCSSLSFSQNFNEHTAGHTFKIQLPDYMNKTLGLNDNATVQYKSAVKDVYGFVIVDTKEDLELVEMNFFSITEFYENFIQTFLEGEENRQISNPITKTIGDRNFLESDASYYDKDANVNVFYLTGVVETKRAYYKVISWSTPENKEKFKSDFQRILYSVSD